MGTILSFHAHPDDESIATGGTLARAADAGHRVVLVFATRGELGEPVAGALSEGEQLTLRRTAEVYESARVLGVDRVEFLGYTDSGMIGEPTNDVPWCFWKADVDQAAHRLAAILIEEKPDVITIYDDNGGYGHPDHIQVHRVGKRAAELVGVPVVAQGTMNRDLMTEAMDRAKELGVEFGADESEELGEVIDPGEVGGTEPSGPAAIDRSTFGKPQAELTHFVDTVPVLDRKRASMLAHGSQIGPDHFMASMPPEAFAFVFGTEWFIVDGADGAEAPDVFTELFTPSGSA